MRSLIIAAALVAASGATMANGAASFLEGFEAGRTGQPLPQRQDRAVQYQEPARAAGRTAFHTGNMRQVELVGGGTGNSCEYQFNYQQFWRAFRGRCPISVEVE